MTKFEELEIAPRIIGAAALAGVAWIHYKDLADKFEEVPYIGAGYILLIVASVLSVVLLVLGTKRERIVGWYVAGATAGAAAIGYTLTRTVGLPHAMDDIGNWSEPLGVWSLALEGTVCAIAVWRVSGHLRTIAGAIVRFAKSKKNAVVAPQRAWAPPKI
jgi:hypothetical protein